MYRALRRGLFALPPETAHDVVLGSLGLTSRLIGGHGIEHPVEVLGLRFSNPVGLAAGLDKNGDHIDALGRLGFGFIEVGTVTPKPQPGNPKPRMFRIEAAEALINRLGFNNKGVDHLVERLKRRTFRGPVGANIGKQKDTPVERAAQDYRICLEKVYAHCDYVTINISSPNTANLRQLQDTGPLVELIAELLEARKALAARHAVQRPILIKIAPDWERPALLASLEAIGRSGIDGLIATNTTLSRAAVSGLPDADETGGLSGAPLLETANQVLATAREVLGVRFPIVGVGGISRGTDARAKIRSGADLVQVYTGFIYRGPRLIGECVEAIRDDA